MRSHLCLLVGWFWVACVDSEDTTPTVVPLIDDSFDEEDESTWKFDDHKLKSHWGPTYYLKNHSSVGATLSLGEGTGLVMTMSNQPCHDDQKHNCRGAAMASAHVQSTVEHSYGDYEARLRAPHSPGGDTCHPSIYGYFTAGYSTHDGVQNEINFGFHPDRDEGGTHVSCESHADSHGYHETNANLGNLNVRAGFHDYRIRLRPTYVEWSVDGIVVNKMNETLSHTMHTSFILRTSEKNGNNNGELPTAIMEWSHFRFTPYDSDSESRRRRRRRQLESLV